MYFTSHIPFFINRLQVNTSSETCVTSLYEQLYLVSQNVVFTVLVFYFTINRCQSCALLHFSGQGIHFVHL